MKGLNINTILKPQQILEQMGGDFGNDTSDQTNDGLRQQVLKVTTGILKLMENTFDALPHPVEQAFEAIRVLRFLVLAFGG